VIRQRKPLLDMVRKKRKQQLVMGKRKKRNSSNPRYSEKGTG